MRKDQDSIVETIERVNDFEKVVEGALEDNVVKLGKNQEENTPISGDNPLFGMASTLDRAL